MPSDGSSSESSTDTELSNEELKKNGICLVSLSGSRKITRLGSGISAPVYRVRYNNTTCAMKVLRTTKTSEKEVAITKTLSEHPNVIGYISNVTLSCNTLLLIEELHDILIEVLKDRTSSANHWANLPTPTQWNTWCLSQILDAICYMAENYWEHGDVHKGNVGFTRHHKPKVLDFGQSRFGLRKWRRGTEKPAGGVLASDVVLTGMLENAKHSSFEIPGGEWGNLDLKSLTSNSYVKTKQGYWEPIYLGPDRDLGPCIYLFIEMQFGIRSVDLYKKAKKLGIGLEWGDKQLERPPGEEYKNAELSELLRDTSRVSWGQRKELKLDGLTNGSYLQVSDNEFRIVCFSSAVFYEMLSDREGMGELLGTPPGVFFEVIRDALQEKLDVFSAREYFKRLCSS